MSKICSNNELVKIRDPVQLKGCKFTGFKFLY